MRKTWVMPPSSIYPGFCETNCASRCVRRRFRSTCKLIGIVIVILMSNKDERRKSVGPSCAAHESALQNFSIVGLGLKKQ